MRHLVCFLAHAHLLENFRDAFVAGLLVFPACSFQYKLEVLVHTAVVQQLEVLEDDAQLLSQRRNILASDGREVSA